MNYLLLQIPGVFDEFIPIAAARMIALMESRMSGVAWKLAVVLLIIAAMCEQGRVWMEAMPAATRTVLRWLLVCLLFAGYYELHYYVYAIPAALAEEIITQADMEQLNNDFSEAAKIGQDGQPLDPRQTERLSFPARLGLAVSLMNPVSYIIPESVMNLTMTVYFFSVPFTHYLWVSLVSVEFVFGKLVIVFGVLPVWGPRALMSYFGAIVSLGLWQIWNAFCAFMVKNADAFFHSRSAVDLVLNGSTVDVTNHYAMIPIALVFTVLSLMGLTFIYLIFGFSKFTMAGGFAMQHGTSTVTNAATNMVMMPVSAYMSLSKLAAGGAAGAAGGGKALAGATAASASAGGAQFGGSGGGYTTGGWMQSGGASKQLGGGKS